MGQQGPSSSIRAFKVTTASILRPGPSINEPKLDLVYYYPSLFNYLIDYGATTNYVLRVKSSFV